MKLKGYDDLLKVLVPTVREIHSTYVWGMSEEVQRLRVSLCLGYLVPSVPNMFCFMLMSAKIYVLDPEFTCFVNKHKLKYVLHKGNVLFVVVTLVLCQLYV